MARSLVRRGFGLRRFPVVTAVVFGVTAATSVRPGNSVAVCGLAGVLVVALAAGARLPRLAPPRWAVPAGRLAAAAADLHGAALAAGIVIAAVTGIA